MKIEQHLFELEGCHCKIRFDPKDVQEAFHTQLQKRLAKEKKLLDSLPGTLTISGKFEEIDEGNAGLRMILVFLGKARVVVRANVSLDNQPFINESFIASIAQLWFFPPKVHVKTDAITAANMCASRIIKELKQRK